MKIFDSTNHTWAEYLDDLNAELIKLISTPLPVEHKIKGSGHITYMKAVDSDVYVTIDFAESSTQYSLRFLLEHSHLILDEAASAIIRNVYDIHSVSITAHQLELKAEIEAKRAADAEKKEAEKREAAEKARREKLIHRAQSLRPEAICSEPKTYYEALGWMAKNVKTIKATVPSDLEPWFIKNFGKADCTIIDSNKKTLNGNPMKWSISFKATFAKELPPILLNKTGSSKKAIDSVAYIWDLIENYGFCFGKVQNLEQIKKHIPDKFIYEFEKGLA